MKIMRMLSVCLLISLPIVFVGWLVDAPAQDLPKDKPIKITANQLEADNNTKKIVFAGEVRAIQDDIVIDCQTLTVTYVGEGDEKGEQSIQRITAEGNVIITQQKRTITGERAEYFRQEEKIVVTGNPIAKEENNQIKGSRIIYFIKEKRSIMEGSESKQVEAIFFPK